MQRLPRVQWPCLPRPDPRPRRPKGDVAVRNYQSWQDIRINMDTICANDPVDTGASLFGRGFRYPFFAGPVGAVYLHYGEDLNDERYNDILVPACRDAGICAFTGDGTNYAVMEGAASCIREAGGRRDSHGQALEPRNAGKEI